VTGPLALHGGGEFLAGDEPFLRAILDLAAHAAVGRDAATDIIRVELLTTAVARHRPDMAFAVGSAAFERVAAERRPRLAPIHVHHARVVDAASAADPDAAERLASADLVYLPGGDPDAALEILAGTAAWHGVERARLRGAAVAGASAGAMALGERTWTRDGYVAGFGWAGRLVVVPHASAERMASMRPAVDALPHGRELAILGLSERCGVTGRLGAWTVIGAAGAWWWPPHASAPRHEPAGAVIRD
jgi:cyanophycinase-like exopeptidase